MPERTDIYENLIPYHRREVINKNEVKKDLYKSKEIAKLTRYKFGNIYYSVKVGNNIYEFPISTIEDVPCIEDENDTELNKVKNFILSTDLGETNFYDEIKGSELNRWISRAIDENTFKKIN
jgi:hypothetical protein